jgi:hypothetical protein
VPPALAVELELEHVADAVLALLVEQVLGLFGFGCVSVSKEAQSNRVRGVSWSKRGENNGKREDE